MESFIFIDGPVMWVVIGFIAFLLLGFAFFALRCLAVEVQNDELIADNTRLYKELKEEQDRLYKLSFKKQLEDMCDV